jgi:hypothetical protein
MEKGLLHFFIITLLLTGSFRAQSQSEVNPLLKLNFLIGEWTGVDEGNQNSDGGSTFYFNLDSNVIIRDNYANYPAADGRPAISHKDLMVIYKEKDSIKAAYYDNEGHIINYNVTADSAKAVFTSYAKPGEPQFRLSYVITGSSTLDCIFELAPPGKDFFTYLSGKLKKK